MADSILFIVQNKKREESREAEIKLFTDVTTSISHQFDNDVTAFPVERGKDITDNIRTRNNRFTVEGVVTDYALTQYKGNTVGYDGIASRRQDMYTHLMKIRNNKLKFTLVTGLDAYESCVIRSFSVPVAPDNASLFTFTIEIEQIREVYTSTVNIVVADVSVPKKDDAAKTSNKGDNTPSETDLISDLGDVLSGYYDFMTDKDLTTTTGGE